MRIESRIQKLETAAGFDSDQPFAHLSHAELDAEFVRAYAECAKLAEGQKSEAEWLRELCGEEPASFPRVRAIFPMTADIQALILKRNGREFYDECAVLSLEEIEGRVKAHIEKVMR